MTNTETVVKGLEFCISPDEDHRCDSCPYWEDSFCDVNLKKDALNILEREPVIPIKKATSKNKLGVNGILIVGTCPECGQPFLNNRDNKFCGGCGRPVSWD